MCESIGPNVDLRLIYFFIKRNVLRKETTLRKKLAIRFYDWLNKLDYCITDLKFLSTSIPYIGWYTNERKNI